MITFPPGIRIFAEKYLENPYPAQPDDGTWEGEGGYVAKPNHRMYLMEVPKAFNFTTPYFERSETIMVMHPLTKAEVEYAIDKK